jgi:hypothetical protein
MKNVHNFNEFLNEQISVNLDKLLDIAKKYDYNNFLTKSDGVTSIYNILYRGMDDGDELTDKSFMTDYIGHAKEYGDYVDGIIYNNGDVLFFDNNVFNDLRNKFSSITEKELYDIYSYYFINNKLFDVMEEEDSVIKFVLNFIKSNIPYTKVQNNKVKNDLLIPIMSHYAKLKNNNIISFVGGDYSDYGGADEFVVDDISRYTKLSDIWKSVN